MEPYRFKDGREVYDHIYATFDFPGGRTATFSSIQSNAFEANYEMFMGTKGTLIMARELDAFLFHEGENSNTRVEISRQSGPVADSSATQAADSTARTVDTPVGGNAGQGNLLPQRDRRVLCGCPNGQSRPVWRRKGQGFRDRNSHGK